MPILIVFLALLLFLIGLPVFNDYRFARMVKAEVWQLFSNMQPQTERTIASTDWQNLPEPVQKYLSRSLGQEQPYIHCVRLKQIGTIRTSLEGSWMPFTADQYFTITPPAFVWHTRAKMLPFLWLVARDKYMAQRGAMLIRLMSTITVADARDSATTSAALLRFAAELMWIPTALVGNEYLRWEAIDSSSARAIVNDEGVEVSLTFHFDENGDIASIAARRYRDASDEQPTPWYGIVKTFSSFNGVRIPSEVEVGWELESGYFAYWRGTITEIDYNTPALYSN